MRIVFMGTPESAVPSLRRLLADGHEIVAVWTQPDKPAGRGKKLHLAPVKQFALDNQLTIHQPARIKNPEAKAAFAAHSADVAVVVAYGKILPPEFLNAPQLGSVNVHFSLLPKYRGAAPVNWALVNGETETGVTTMKIVEELDAGPILLQKTTGIGSEETAPQLMTRLADLGADLLAETLRRLKEIRPRPQTDEAATYAPVLKREDGLIDWSVDAPVIERRIRGLQPWPNAYTSFRSRRLVIWNASAHAIEDSSFALGEIISARSDSLTIKCGGATALQLLEVQPESGRRLSARDFLNGARVTTGEFLTSAPSGSNNPKG